LVAAAFLKRCSRADGRVEGNVIGLAIGGTRLDIASAFSLGMRMRAASGVVAG